MFALANLANPRFRYGYKGFTSIVTQFIDMAKLHHSMYENYRVLVQDPQISLLYDNVFEPDEKEHFYEIGDVYLSKFFAGEIDTTHTAHTLSHDDDLRNRHRILNEILKVKPELLLQFEHKKNRLFGDKRVLGVQVRGTDKKTEIVPPDMNSINDNIQKILNTRLVESIYVATDDASYLDSIRRKFGELVIFDEEKEISYDGKPLHFRKADREKLNEQVLEDVYLLSNSDHFLYSFSNVSHLALIMGIDNHISKVNINIQ